MYIGVAGREKGICVNDCDAYKYALEQLQWSEELQGEFVEWFYSGNYVHEREDGGVRLNV